MFDTIPYMKKSCLLTICFLIQILNINIDNKSTCIYISKFKKLVSLIMLSLHIRYVLGMFAIVVQLYFIKKYIYILASN